MLWEQNSMLWEQNIFLVGTRYYVVGTRYYIEGTKSFFFSHGLNQSPYLCPIEIKRDNVIQTRTNGKTTNSQVLSFLNLIFRSSAYRIILLHHICICIWLF